MTADMTALERTGPDETGAETMDAVVLDGPGKFSVEQVAVPRPGPHEVLCRVRAIAICGTDTHIIEGDFPGFWPPGHPFIPGHEWAGDVVEAGPGAGQFGWKTGDRVAGTSHAACGFCPKCAQGAYNLCENYGRQEVHRHYGHNAQGSYATYTVHSIKSVVRIPDAMSYDEAALLDPASIALHTAHRGGVRAGHVVAVTGAGIIGLLAAECARALGAGRVIVVGRGQRLRAAAALGHEVIDTADDDPVVALREATEGRGVDVALECAGAVQPADWCLRSLRRGGRCAVVGIPLEKLTLALQGVVLDELELVGVRASAGEMGQVLPLVTSGRVRVRELITHRFPLAQFPEAYRTFITRTDGALKVVVHP